MLARAENDVDFFSRRAMEEARAAAAAKTVAVGSAHRQMAAIYAQRLRDEQLIAEGASDPLSDLCHRDLDLPPDDEDWIGGVPDVGDSASIPPLPEPGRQD